MAVFDCTFHLICTGTWYVRETDDTKS
jgi:hypothetical protein